MGSKKGITKETIEAVAELAHLTLKKGEAAKFKDQLSNIFGFIEGVSKVKTSGTKATADVTGLVNVTREDKINKDLILTQTQALSQAKKTYKGYFLVRSVFKQNE